MPNLFASLRSSADAIGVFERALNVTQNNVSNANTPGYAKQRLPLVPMPFDPTSGTVGGVAAGELQSARDEYAETAVRRQTESLGRFEQMAASLGPVELGFDVSGQAGIPGALNGLFSSFSAWSVNPSDPNAQQAVLNSAWDVARSFQQASAGLAQAAADTQSQIRGVAGDINALAQRVQQYNVERGKNSATENPGLDADVHNTLEQLSELANITVLKQPDGAFTVLLAGQTPLVVGANQYRLSAAFQTVPAGNTGPVSAQILDASGNDVTSQVSNGKLGGLLEVHNDVLASLRGDGTQQGDLNILAQAVADRVNTILANQAVPNGPAQNPPLFSYGGDPTQIAQTLTVNPAVTPGSLTANDNIAQVSNGIALSLAALAHPQNAADQINGISFVQFYAGMAAKVGGKVADAKANQDLQNQLVVQARSLRAQNSAVSLDEEAVQIIQFQRAYEAVAKMVTVIDEMTQTIVNAIT